MNISKELLSLAGEYAVASELCRMGMYAQLTFGHQKKTDILVLNPENNKMITIEVKSKQQSDFPNCQGIKGKNAFLVLVDFKNKKPEDMPDFYILSEKDWLDFVNAEIEKHPDKDIRIENNCPVWYGQVKNGRPYKGMGIKPKQVKENRDKWDLITKAIE